jgi:MIP family channel proteins
MIKNKIMAPNLFRKCLAEFIGAFTIVFGGCGAVVANACSEGAVGHYGVATTFGLIVMALIYSLGHISGAHFNPAVTLSFALFRHFPVKEIIPYISAQILGCIFASFVHDVTIAPGFLRLYPEGILPLGVTQPFDGSWLTGFIWEVILTAILMMVVMAVATDFRAVGGIAGVAIGSTVLFEAMFAGPICGASMNPARSIGPALMSGELTHLSAYIAGPILGAILGAGFYNLMRCSHPSEPLEIKGCC